MNTTFGAVVRTLKAALANPRAFARSMKKFRPRLDGEVFARGYCDSVPVSRTNQVPEANPLEQFFDQKKEGHGIWKWEHYFEIYHRHLQKFVGTDVNVLEIGIYSGGSLEMWRSYFGDRCHIYGVDIEEACQRYENEYTTILIGDQENRRFWKEFREKGAGIDILIDDGGHTPMQQQVTLEEMLPHLRPGGVYICEDITGRSNDFTSFATGLVEELNSWSRLSGEVLGSEVSRFQRAVHSIHFYPYVVVIEKHQSCPSQLIAPKHGTIWQPFFEKPS